MTPASRTVSCRDAAGGALVDAGSAVAEMQLEGHSSMQAPQLLHLEVSMIATSSQVMAFSGQTSTHAPHATHSEALIVVI